MRLLQDSSGSLCFSSLHPILVNSMFFSFRSYLTLSIQVFLCLPLLLFPYSPCKDAFGSLFPSIRSTCSNHCSLLFLIFCITVSSAPKLFSCLLISDVFSSTS